MNKRLLTISALLLGLTLCSASCEGKKSSKEDQTENKEITVEQIESPFNADSAFLHIQRQVEFGPRVPNSTAHKACAKYLSDYLKEQGLVVTLQDMVLTAWDNTKLESVNIIGEYNPEASSRILLFAHWDTRPLADHDKNASLRDKPIDGADDGASGVGVLMEVVRLLREHPLRNIGIDIMFFDAEDYGVPEGEDYSGDSSETWALGTQYWAKNPHKEGYKADFGILLDMVGAKGATFYREYFSQEAAGSYVSKIWDTAARIGHRQFFRNEMGGAVTDDHIFVIKHRRIPCVDIINYDPHSSNGFGDYWHTHKDNIDNISTVTLNAVGQTIWQVITDYDASMQQ